MAALSLNNLTKHFPGGVRAVDGLTLDARDGELLVLVGASGCGKTTTLRLIAGLEMPTAGSIALDGRRLDGVPPRDRDVAMVFQHHALYPHLTVAGNLGFGLKLRGFGAPEIERRVRRAADMLGIGELLARRPGELSGGQQQRVALGRAIVRQAGLFLFDEPLSNLDPALRCELRAEIRRLLAELRATTVYVTHDQAEAMSLGRRIAVMHQGRLEQLADPATIYRQPANRIVAAMFGSPGMNFLEGCIELSDGEPAFVGQVQRITAGSGADDHAVVRFADPADRARLGPFAGRPVTLGIRPEHVVPADGCPPQMPRIRATVGSVERLGADTLVHLSTGGQALVMRTHAPDCQPGDKLEVGIPGESVRIFDPENGKRLE